MAQQTAVEWLIEQKLSRPWEEIVEEAKAMEKEQIIAFHKWMLVNDTEQNAEKYFHYTDENMWHEFLNSKR